jgi:hypothetical protein
VLLSDEDFHPLLVRTFRRTSHALSALARPFSYHSWAPPAPPQAILNRSFAAVGRSRRYGRYGRYGRYRLVGVITGLRCSRENSTITLLKEVDDIPNVPALSFGDAQSGKLGCKSRIVNRQR